ncbi:MAG: phage terminase small subunit P27 family [Bryobacteraceae bacterium]
MKGRKPVPASIKKLEGNPGKRPIRPELSVPDGIPECPDHLTSEAKSEWCRIAGQLHEIGILTTLDRTALAVYCQTWARWTEAELRIQEQGLLVKSPNGYEIQNPYLPIANKALEQLKAFLAELGMTPTARTRLSVQPAPKKLNVFASLGD